MPPYEERVAGGSGRDAIVFNASKGEQLTVKSGYASVLRRLKTQWRVESNRDFVTDDTLREARVFVLPAPSDKFTEAEFDAMRKFVGTDGGSLLAMLGEGGERRFGTNINYLLEEFGVMINNDTVVRTAYFKYFNPKEALISNGVLNRAIAQAAGKQVFNNDDDESNLTTLTFVYPFGASLNVNIKHATPVLSSGSVSFPLNRPVCAFYKHPTSGGKVVVLGSAEIFADDYLDKEENGKIFDVVMKYLTTDEVKLNGIDADDPEVSDYYQIPDTMQLSEEIKVCLHEGEAELQTSDLTKLFDASLYASDLGHWPKALKAYEKLRVKYEPLKLITPQLEMPLPGLQLAVFPPRFRDLPPPELELYDLDDSFSTERVRLAQISNKCSEGDLEFFVSESAEILGVTQKLPPEQRKPIYMLEYILNQLAEFKKLNQDMGDYASFLNDELME